VDDVGKAKVILLAWVVRLTPKVEWIVLKWVVLGPKIFKIRCILHTAQVPYVRSYGSGGRGPGVRAAKFVNDLRFANDLDPI
jgi:hypothetical protein